MCVFWQRKFKRFVTFKWPVDQQTTSLCAQSLSHYWHYIAIEFSLSKNKRWGEWEQTNKKKTITSICLSIHWESTRNKRFGWRGDPRLDTFDQNEFRTRWCTPDDEIYTKAARRTRAVDQLFLPFIFFLNLNLKRRIIKAPPEALHSARLFPFCRSARV
jgi:hypothetical protein